MIKNVCENVSEEVINNNFEITWQDFSSTLKEALDYYSSSREQELDEKFIKWLIRKKCSS